MKLYGVYKEWDYPEEKPECKLPVWKEYIIKDLYKRKLAKAVWFQMSDRDLGIDCWHRKHYHIHLRDDNDVDISLRIYDIVGYYDYPVATCSVKEVYKYICQ